jgi:hypothetical protein
MRLHCVASLASREQIDTPGDERVRPRGLRKWKTDQAFLYSIYRRCRSVGLSELHQEVLHVRSDGTAAQDEGVRDLGVAHTGREQRQDVELTRCQLMRDRRSRYANDGAPPGQPDRLAGCE